MTPQNKIANLHNQSVKLSNITANLLLLKLVSVILI